MTQRRVYDVLVGALALTLVVGGLASTHGETVAVGGFVAVGYGLSYWGRRRARDRWAQLREAMVSGDAERMEKLLASITEELTPGELRQVPVDYVEAVLLMMREDWQAALDRVERLQRVPPGQLAFLRARCLAELGHTEEATTMAQAALGRPKISAEERAGTLVVLAIGLLQQRQFEKVLTTLAEAARASAGLGVQASCSFYRAEALRALGREAEARDAYQRTIDLVPRSRRAAHARERLAAAPPSAYR
jgi:tetratricopeptide (TPR) repeat protein